MHQTENILDEPKTRWEKFSSLASGSNIRIAIGILAVQFFSNSVREQLLVIFVAHFMNLRHAGEQVQVRNQEFTQRLFLLCVNMSNLERIELIVGPILGLQDARIFYVACLVRHNVGETVETRFNQVSESEWIANSSV